MVHLVGMKEPTPIEKAIAAVGGADRFCDLFAIKRRAYFNWKAGRYPTDRVPEIARLTGVPRHELRPELWDAPAEAAIDQHPSAA